MYPCCKKYHKNVLKTDVKTISKSSSSTTKFIISPELSNIYRFYTVIQIRYKDLLKMLELHIISILYYKCKTKAPTRMKLCKKIKQK